MGNDKPLSPPSEEFEDALLSAGNLVTECGLCNRTHFATESPGHYEEGELENLRKKAAEKPERYLEHSGYDAVSVGFLDNVTVVLGCPCNRLRKYEDFIWNNRNIIVKYLKSRIAERRKSVDRDEELVRGLERD